MGTYISSYDLENSIFSFFKYVESINTSTNLNVCKNKLNLYIKNIKRLINDIDLYIDVLSIDKENALNELDTFSCLIEVEKESAIVIKNNLTIRQEDFTDVLGLFCNINDVYIKNDMKGYMRLNSYLNDINPTNIDISVLNKIAISIFSKNKIKIFDPQCSNGHNVINLRSILDPTELYGLDTNEFDVKTAKSFFEHIILGELKGSKISNKVFDVLFIAPRISIQKLNTNKQLESNEKYMLKNTSKYLKDNGLFIYTIPFYRLTNDMLLYVSKNFQDISIFQHLDQQNKVTIMAYKKHNKDYESTFNHLASLNLDTIPSYKNFHANYKVEGDSLEVNMFRGSILDIKELEDIVQNDGLYEEFYESLNNENVNNDSPLIPFNLGQIGLVLTSGQLDGVIDEVGGVKHVIKGMTVKSTVEERESTGKNTYEEVRTISNIIQINIVDGVGNLKTLL